MTSDLLRASLQQLPLTDLEVRVTGLPPRLLGVVISPDFEEQNGAIRQRQIWRHLLDNLSPEQLAGIEFVFTYTPQEMASLDRGERPSPWR